MTYVVEGEPHGVPCIEEADEHFRGQPVVIGSLKRTRVLIDDDPVRCREDHSHRRDSEVDVGDRHSLVKPLQLAVEMRSHVF